MVVFVFVFVLYDDDTNFFYTLKHCFIFATHLFDQCYVYVRKVYRMLRFLSMSRNSIFRVFRWYTFLMFTESNCTVVHIFLQSVVVTIHKIIITVSVYFR